MMFKVFPATILPDGKKVPLIEGWQSKATTDPGQIQIWQQQFGDRLKLWGAPTGDVNGIFVLDIDVKNGVNGFDKLKEHGVFPEATAWQTTPSGGVHLIYKDDPTLGLRNTANREIGIDTRANGGWIGLYQINDIGNIRDIPAWVHSVVRKPVNQIDPSQRNTYQLNPQQALEKFWTSIQSIRDAQPGERNQTLNIHAYIIGQLVEAGAIPKDFAYQHINEAATSIGLDAYEIQATTLSGFKGGAANPLTHPFGSQPPVPAIPIIPEMPVAAEPPARWTPVAPTLNQLKDWTKLKKPQLFENWSTIDPHLTSAIGGVGKTTLKLYEAVCLALNVPFLGFKCLKPGRTVFIIGEDSEAKLYAMLGQICRELGLFEPGREAELEAVRSNVFVKLATDLCLVALDKHRQVFVPHPEAMDKIQQVVEDLQPVQIVFDPIAMFWGPESAGNDMAMGVSKALLRILQISNASVDVISHIGKDSATRKDTGQFSARGATAIANHSRVVRTLLKLNDDEYRELMGAELAQGEKAIQCFVSKFSDGSPLLDNPFIIVRKGFGFERRDIPARAPGERNTVAADKERILNFLRNNSTEEKPLTEEQIAAHFFLEKPKINKATTKAAISMLKLEGLVEELDHADITVGRWVRVCYQN